MNNDLDKFLSLVSDAEMDHITRGYGALEGMQKIIQLAVERASSLEIRKIKDMLDGAPYGNRVPQEVKDYINIARAKFMYHNRGLTVQMPGEDDRFGENIDNVLIHFGYWEEGDDIGVSAQRLQDDIVNDGEGHSSIGSILMRTIPESLKILIFYLKIKSLKDIKKIVSAYEGWLRNMGHGDEFIHGRNRDQYEFYGAASYSVLGDNHHFQGHFGEAIEDFVTISEDISRSPILWYIKKFHISDIGTFTKLLFGEAYNYGFFLLANIPLVEYFLDAIKISSLEQFETFLKDDSRRNALVSFSQQDGGVGNLIKFLRRFDLKDPGILVSFNDNLRQALIKAKPENLDILFGIFGIKSQEEFSQLLGKELIQRSIESVTYAPIWELLWTDGLLDLTSEGKSQLFFHLLSQGVTSDISESIKKLNIGLKSLGDSQGVGEVLLKILAGSDIAENIHALTHLTKLSLNEKSGILDFRKLLVLLDFLDGVITPYLGREILFAEKPPQTVLSEWQDTIEGFKDGLFDSNNDLHRNLEYRKFRKLSSGEILKKYMGQHFGITAFLSLFEKQGDDYMEVCFAHEQAEFELECLIYEANVLKQQILSINEMAKGEGRRIVIVPNLSYGYLPVSAIADEIYDPNIEFYYGAKVGSTESHHNREVISSSLLIDIRDRFMTDQPILIVVDGTTNIQQGKVKHIKYPDAYEGYLNQMIAWNYIQGLDDPKQVDYSIFGKTDKDIERLFEDKEFQRTVDIYRLSGKKPAMPYKMLFYNTGDLDLTIRDTASDNGTRVPRKFSLKDVTGPSVVFCNVGLLHDQLSEELKNSKIKHVPAYFDDSGRIIALEYSFDHFGLQIVNPIESRIMELKNGTGGCVRPKIISQI